MTRERLGKLAALAQGAALVGLGACSNQETPVQAPSSAAVVPAVDAGDATDDAGGVAGGRGPWWRRHGPPNALPPRARAARAGVDGGDSDAGPADSGP